MTFDEWWINEGAKKAKDEFSFLGNYSCKNIAKLAWDARQAQAQQQDSADKCNDEIHGIKHIAGYTSCPECRKRI